MKKEKYIKNVLGFEFTPSYPDNNFILYAKKGEKYKEWDFVFMIIFVYYRNKIAKENLYTDTGMPYKEEIFTEKDLERAFHIVVKENGELWKMAKLQITLSDGSVDEVWVKSDEEARKIMEKLIKNNKLMYWSKNEL